MDESTDDNEKLDASSSDGVTGKHLRLCGCCKRKALDEISALG